VKVTEILIHLTIKLTAASMKLAILFTLLAQETSQMKRSRSYLGNPTVLNQQITCQIVNQKK
jgi:hypothetical protein